MAKGEVRYRMALTREVLPPRQVPTSMSDMVRTQLEVAEACAEARARAAIIQAIWTSVILVGLVTLTVRLLETL